MHFRVCLACFAVVALGTTAANAVDTVKPQPLLAAPVLPQLPPEAPQATADLQLGRPDDAADLRSKLADSERNARRSIALAVRLRQNNRNSVQTIAQLSYELSKAQSDARNVPYPSHGTIAQFKADIAKLQHDLAESQRQARAAATDPGEPKDQSPALLEALAKLAHVDTEIVELRHNLAESRRHERRGIALAAALRQSYSETRQSNAALQDELSKVTALNKTQTASQVEGSASQTEVAELKTEVAELQGVLARTDQKARRSIASAIARRQRVGRTEPSSATRVADLTSSAELTRLQNADHERLLENETTIAQLTADSIDLQNRLNDATVVAQRAMATAVLYRRRHAAEIQAKTALGEQLAASVPASDYVDQHAKLARSATEITELNTEIARLQTSRAELEHKLQRTLANAVGQRQRATAEAQISAALRTQLAASIPGDKLEAEHSKLAASAADVAKLTSDATTLRDELARAQKTARLSLASAVLQRRRHNAQVTANTALRDQLSSTVALSTLDAERAKQTASATQVARLIREMAELQTTHDQARRQHHRAIAAALHMRRTQQPPDAPLTIAARKPPAATDRVSRGRQEIVQSRETVLVDRPKAIRPAASPRTRRVHQPPPAQRATDWRRPRRRPRQTTAVRRHR